MAAACGLLTACMVYFKLVVIQVEGLLLEGEHQWWNAVLNGVVMLGWLLMTKRCDVDTQISGYGFFSIAAYFLFLLWAALTAPAGDT
jgi:hydrogenase-4 membrane subunit HyfE